MQPGNFIREGKTKIVYEHYSSKDLVLLYFKDDITAGDGLKHDVKEGVGYYSWLINQDCFALLNRNNLRTHYLGSPEEKYVDAVKMDTIYPLEVVVRRVAAGSLPPRSLYTEGDWFNALATEFFMKCDSLHDPKLDEDFLVYSEKKNRIPYGQMEDTATTAFILLEQSFTQHKHQLIDLKVEFGMRNNMLFLIDDITPGSFRLWPYKNDRLTPAPNVFDQLDKDGMKDKQLYRNGKDLDTVIAAYKFVAELTGKFL